MPLSIIIITIILSIAAIGLIGFLLYCIKYNVYLTKRRQIINNGGCYIYNAESGCYEWYTYIKPYLCRDYVMLHIRRKYYKIILIATKTEDIIKL